MKIKNSIPLRSDNTVTHFEIDKPNVCPDCQQSGDHTMLNQSINRVDKEVSLTLECTMCYSIFFAKFDVITPKEKFHHIGPVITYLKQTFPLQKVETNLPEEMNALFPEFENIYSQATYAEVHGLDLIKGIAFRKAVEFLVKQYLIDSDPDQEQEIRDEFLGKSIKRIQHPLIHKLSTAATWLGNDEGHFTRKHEDYDVADMKRFILALSHLIVAEKVAEAASQLVDQ